MKREIFTGLILGLLSNVIGMTACIFIISKIKGLSFSGTLDFYTSTSSLYMVIALGALPNLLLFFWLLNKNKEYRARGVVLATFIAAISAYIIYFK